MDDIGAQLDLLPSMIGGLKLGIPREGIDPVVIQRSRLTSQLHRLQDVSGRGTAKGKIVIENGKTGTAIKKERRNARRDGVLVNALSPNPPINRGILTVRTRIVETVTECANPVAQGRKLRLLLYGTVGLAILASRALPNLPILFKKKISSRHSR